MVTARGRAYDQYREMKTTPVDGLQIILMAYKRIRENIDHSIKMIDEKKYYEKGQKIANSLDLIHELMSSLDMDKGGEIAKQLNDLYLSCIHHLMVANEKLDTKRLRQVDHIIKNIEDGFLAIEQKRLEGQGLAVHEDDLSE